MFKLIIGIYRYLTYHFQWYHVKFTCTQMHSACDIYFYKSKCLKHIHQVLCFNEFEHSFNSKIIIVYTCKISIDSTWLNWFNIDFHSIHRQRNMNIGANLSNNELTEMKEYVLRKFHNWYQITMNMLEVLLLNYQDMHSMNWKVMMWYYFSLLAHML